MDCKETYIRQIEAVIEQGPYKDDWNSLCRHETPVWFKDAKFGIFVHWGIYSVPAFGSEWYSRNMYIRDSKEFEHHRQVYGEHKDFGYKDFIPMFTGENFDPSAWISLFQKAGARYVVPVAEHHDGFQMYRSEISHWNSCEMGPGRDVLGELTEEAKKAGMTEGASSHRMEHWFFMGHGKEFESDITDAEKPGDFYWPAMPEGDLYDSESEPAPTSEFLEDWMVRTCEIIDRYHVKKLYFDWWIQHVSARPYLRKVAAYYYNRAVEWGEEVLMAYKYDSFMFGSALVGIERGQFATSQPYYWQTNTAIAKHSWSYTEQNEYKTAGSIIRDLVDIVSKNGNLLLNVGPKADGTISQEETEVLLDIGQWLDINGEAIYGSRVWRTSFEGSVKPEDGQFKDNLEKVFTGEDFRFTVNGSCLYAICMAYPGDGRVLVKSLSNQSNSVFRGVIDNVKVLGFEEVPQWKRTEDGLEIVTETVKSDNPVVFRIEMK